MTRLQAVAGVSSISVCSLFPPSRRCEKEIAGTLRVPARFKDVLTLITLAGSAGGRSPVRHRD